MLVGRSVELDLIGALLDGARAGHAGALVLRGEAGIGKSALLDWATEQAGDLRVVRAVGVESEAELACAGLHQLLRPLLGHLDDLPPPQAAALRAALAIDAAGATERFAVYAGTLGLLAAAAEHQPLLCVVEDAHWLDTVSAEALVFAARRLDAEPVAMLFAARIGERPFAIGTLPELRVNALDDEASLALLRTTGRRIGTGTEHALLRLACGNPLALLELPRGLNHQQLLGTAPLDDPLPVSGDLEAAFVTRVTRLSREARRSLALAAACESELIAVDQGRLGGFEEAAAAGLVRLDGGAVRFRHPLVRAAAYQAASPAERRDVHAELASALADDPDQHAWHLAAAAAAPDEEVALRLVEVAARAGRRGSTAARARALTRAAQLTPDAAARARRLLDAAEAAFVAGQVAEATALLERADRLIDDPVLRADLTFLRWLIQSADWERLYATMLHDAQAVLDLDPRRAARMLSATTDFLIHSARPEEAAENHRRARALVGAIPIAGLLGVAVDEAWIQLEELRPTSAVDVALTALAAGASTDDPGDLDDLPYGAQVLVFAEHPSAESDIDALVSRARTEGRTPLLCAALAVRAERETREGRLLAAYGSGAEAVAIGEAVGGWREFWAQTALALVEAHLGHVEACRMHAAPAIEAATPEARWWTACAHRALGVLALATGDAAGAVRDLGLAESLIPVVHPGIFGCGVDHVEALLRAGATTDGLMRLAGLEDRAGRAALPWTSAAARRCRLLVVPEADLDGVARGVIRDLEGGSPLALGRAHLIYGERLRRVGRRVDAREQLSAALEAFERLGAEPWAERARRELRASGATLRRRDPSAADVLTPQELQIALAVAEGRTNREVGATLFISPKTVELHLSRVYRKLGIHSRGELIRLQAAEPARLGGVSDYRRESGTRVER